MAVHLNFVVVEDSDYGRTKINIDSKDQYREVYMEFKVAGHSKDYYMHTDCAGTPTCLYT